MPQRSELGEQFDTILKGIRRGNTPQSPWRHVSGTYEKKGPKDRKTVVEIASQKRPNLEYLLLHSYEVLGELPDTQFKFMPDGTLIPVHAIAGLSETEMKKLISELATNLPRS